MCRVGSTDRAAGAARRPSAPTKPDIRSNADSGQVSNRIGIAVSADNSQQAVLNRNAKAPVAIVDRIDVASLLEFFHPHSFRQIEFPNQVQLIPE
jgi:hypothetical protein